MAANGKRPIPSVTVDEDTGLMRVKMTRDLTEALDECEREYQVRARCFPRWVSEGRLSATDAQDRLDRLFSATLLLAEMAMGQSTTPKNVATPPR